jgi:hypothetical protein
VFVPFLRIPANLFNASLNYTPIGALRAARGIREVVSQGDGRFTTEMRKLSPEERDRRYLQATLGSAMMGGLALLALGDDDDRWFDITAEGPSDPRRRNQLRATGWVPHAIRIGDRWIRYIDSPLFIPMTVIGSAVDEQRYGRERDEGWLPGGVRMIQRGGSAVFQTSMLSGLMELNGMVSNQATPERVIDFMARSASNIAVPNLVTQVERTIDQTIRDSDTALGRLGKNIPGVRETASPRFDLLGETISNPPSKRFTSAETDDPLWRVIANKAAWISTPSRDTKLGDRTMTDDEYREFVRISGEGIARRLRPVVALLERLPADKAQDTVERIVREERGTAKARMRARSFDLAAN